MKVAVWVLAAVMAFGCAGVQKDSLAKMGVDYTFASKHKCQGGSSPEIRLTGVPAGVASYEVTLTDLDVPSFNHWRQTLRATGPLIREGAGTGYYGPCPPSGTHRYRIEVLAKDAQGKPLAYGEKTVSTTRN